MTTWMDLEALCQSDISQAGKDKYHMISFICEVKKKKKSSLDTENRLGAARGVVGEDSEQNR